MKIYGDYSFLLDKLSVRNQTQIKLSQGGTKIVEFADKFIEEQRAASKDQMTISQEGMLYIRDQLSDLSDMAKSGQADDKAQADRALTLITGKDMSLMDGLCSTYISLRLDVVDAEGVSRNLYMDLEYQYRKDLMDKESTGKADQSFAERMDSMTKAYASVRQKITEGYENGTREVWVQDYSTGEDFNGVELEVDGQAVRYRKLTKEEEISYLDKSIDRLIEGEAEKYVKEEEHKRAAEAKREREDESSNKSLDALRAIVDGLVNEARTLLDRVREEIEKLEKMNEKEIDIEGRMAAEASYYRSETIARGQRQAQCENYKKMSQMASDVRTLLGNVRA